MAPEIFFRNGYTTKADMFGIGSIFFTLLTGKNMISAENINELMEKNAFFNFHELEPRLTNVTCTAKHLLF